MTKRLEEAVADLRELPEDEQEGGGSMVIFLRDVQDLPSV